MTKENKEETPFDTTLGGFIIFHVQSVRDFQISNNFFK